MCDFTPLPSPHMQRRKHLELRPRMFAEIFFLKGYITSRSPGFISLVIFDRNRINWFEQNKTNGAPHEDMYRTVRTHPLLSLLNLHNPTQSHSHLHSISNPHHVWYVWCLCAGEANTNRFILIIVICAIISGVVGVVTTQLNKFKDSKVVTPPSSVNYTTSLNSTSNSTSNTRMVGRMFISWKGLKLGRRCGTMTGSEISKKD